MRNWIFCACIALAWPSNAFGQQPAAADKAPASANAAIPSSPSKDAGAQSKLAEMLEAKVKAAWAAYKKRDKNGYAAFLTDDFEGVESDGDGERPKPHILREVEHSIGDPLPKNVHRRTVDESRRGVEDDALPRDAREVS
jgi:hypothetical protein